MGEIRNLAFKKKVDQGSIWDMFIQEVKTNLHVLLTMSPVGNSLRNRCRKFPALVNCCTLNWFFPWSKSVLSQVSKKFFKGFQLPEKHKDKFC